MKRLKWLALITVLVLALPLMPAGAQVAGNVATSSKGGNWYIVQFEDPPLATYATATVSRRSVMTVGGKLNVSAPASQAYVGQLEKQQAAFAKSLAAAIPGARIERGYQIVLNAVAVELPSDDLETLKALWSMPGVVRVSPQQIYTVEMDYSLPLINASALWDQLGGREAAGEGIKVAVIDTGIDPDHAMFDGTGCPIPPRVARGPRATAPITLAFATARLSLRATIGQPWR